MLRLFRRLSLRTQLLVLMLFMMFVSLGALAYSQVKSERKILSFIEDHIDDLTNAIQVSVDQITAKGKTDEARLKDYTAKLAKKGIKEVSILSSDQKVIMSSNQRRVGSKISVAKKQLFIQASLGGEGDTSKKFYNVNMPVMAEGSLLGYIHINMYLGDFESLSKEMHYSRMAILVPLFGIGILLCIFISYQYTKPISSLIKSMRSLADGVPPSLPDNLQGEMAQLAGSLTEAVHRLREQKSIEEKLKKAEQQAQLAHLSSGIAHEIRNPMNFIGLTLDHIATLPPVRTNNELSELIQKMKKEIKRLDQMVSNFLDLGRELRLYPIPLRGDLPVEDVLGLNQKRLKERGITVKKDYVKPVPVVIVDIDKIKSCFSNIIGNAIDAMYAGGVLTISIKKESDNVCFEFNDTGQGIPPDKIARIFEPYFSAKEGGIGLGLAITKRIVEAHGGAIEVQSKIGTGTMIKVTISVA
ncbi:MAG: HAMP domain-containing sensor histidine kinase [Pseudomonadota bacterium]